MPPKLLLPFLVAVLAPAWVLSAAEPEGKQLYATHCASCHGLTGKGDGPAAVYVYPKPRDFSRGMFKLRSTPDGQMPTDEDLFNSITRGMIGSSMPSFSFLSEAERKALVAHVKSLVTQETTAPQPITVGREPIVTPETVAEGKKLYAKMQCFKCHGELGKGDGPSAATLKDSWDYPIKVRDFTTGLYLGGPTDRDLYLRFTTGMSGTPMPSYQDSLNDEERWKLVHYVQSLRVSKQEESVEPPNGVIRAAKGKVSADPTDKAWDKSPAFQIPTTMLWPCPHPLRGVRVKALHDGKQLAIWMEWEAEAPSQASVRPQDFTDAAALQFSMKGTTPFLGMGDKDNPVNIWQWKASWQQTVEGHRPDVETQYASMHVDITQPRKEPVFVTARAAGNIVAAAERNTPIEDLNAAGFGTLKAQPAEQQNVSGKGVWTAGAWRAVFVRDLKTKDANDQQFDGTQVPVAFAVWGGEHRDRNGQKAVSSWYRLEIAQ